MDGLISLMEYVLAGDSGVFNLGSSVGSSVLDVIAAAKRIGGREVEVVLGPRRLGDAPQLVADITRAQLHLGFSPSRSNLDSIIEEQLHFATMRATTDV